MMSRNLRFIIKHGRYKSYKLSGKREISRTSNNQNLILDTLNTADEEKLQRLKLTNVQIKNIIEYRENNGQFNTVDDIFKVKGVNSQIINKLQNIDSKSTETDKTNETSGMKIRGQLLTPPLHNTKKLKSVVGINITTNFVSWSKVECEPCCLMEWNLENLSDIASKKSHIVDVFKTANNLITKIPVADVYVFESLVQNNLTAQKQLLTIIAQQKLMQIVSMLVALLNTSPLHNASLQSSHSISGTNQHCVHFLRSKISARLFKTLIGSERVASNETVMSIFNGDMSVLHCKPIIVTDTLKSSYELLPGIEKEILGQSLMLTLTFMNLCVYKHPDSIQSVSNRKPAKDK